MDRQEILSKINSVQWYQKFEILPGIFTPGKVPTDPKVLFAHLGLPSDLAGKRVLEIGTWDGPVAFECEARGAVVTGLDIQDPCKTGFNVAKEILNSKVEYVQGSVYDLTVLLKNSFDYVFFLGVFYHLKNPVLAFEQIASILRDDGVLVYEGECLRLYAEDTVGSPYQDEQIRQLALSQLPISLFYADTYKGDDSSWFVPNAACLRSWLRAAGFSITREAFHEDRSTTPPQQRTAAVAQKMAGLRVEHRLVE